MREPVNPLHPSANPTMILAPPKSWEQNPVPTFLLAVLHVSSTKHSADYDAVACDTPAQVALRVGDQMNRRIRDAASPDEMKALKRYVDQCPTILRQQLLVAYRGVMRDRGREDADMKTLIAGWSGWVLCMAVQNLSDAMS